MVGLVGTSIYDEVLGKSNLGLYTSPKRQDFVAPRSFGDRDTINLSPEAQKLQDGQAALRGQRISFLQRQLSELNKQLEILGGFLDGASASNAGPLRSGIADVGRQLQGIGKDIGFLVESSSTSVTIEQVSGSFSQSFNAASIGRGGSLAYSQQLEGEFSFTRISVQEESTSLSVVADGQGGYSIETQSTITTSEITITSASVSSSESLIASRDPLSDLISQYDNTSQAFDVLVNEALKAFEEDDGGINQLLKALDATIENNQINLYV